VDALIGPIHTDGPKSIPTEREEREQKEI